MKIQQSDTFRGGFLARRARTGVLVALPCLVGSQFLVASTLSLERLIKEYEAAKREWVAAARPQAAGGRGSGAARPAKRTALEPLLEKIIRLDEKIGARFVAGEYGEANLAVASASARSLLAVLHEKAVRTVASGFDRGGRWSASTKAAVLDALVVDGGGEGLSFVLLRTKSGSAADRAVSLGSLALAPRSERALDGIVTSLGDRQLEIRRAAVRALEGFRQKAMIRPLIDRIGKERDESLRIDVLQLLVDVTGYNMGFVVEDWTKWWKEADGQFEFQKAEGTTRVVAPDLRYFGIEITSKRISFVIDASKSMLQKSAPRTGKRKIDVLKEELTRILNALPEETAVNIIFFHKQVLSWKNELHFLRGSGREEAVKFVRALTCQFGTKIYDAMESALQDRRVDTIYLLSDGRPVGGKFTAPEDILREIGAINRVRCAKIHTISFGKETQLLKELAAENGGQYRATSPARPKKKQKKP